MGVVHVLDRVLVPPRKIQDKDGEELMIEELVERLDGCVYGVTRVELQGMSTGLRSNKNNLKLFIPMFVFQSRWRDRCLQNDTKNVTLELTPEKMPLV
ncbi:hypothetical protein VN97_g7003 [Penicillium thymicola]|uniref:FAS1 domain-containing protein n=1 Tax=Penicillium thymicola TaxID=293382 RepID=A0AAI9TH55_PENTH|nr:hypothetical protein VN97_g7003 [Penicillium thymicola]